jgi:hypothetical protein
VKLASRKPVRTWQSCSGVPSTCSVARTVYSFGFSMSHSVTPARSDSVTVTVTCPVWLIVAGAEAEEITAVPSSSSAVMVTAPLGTAAASTVHCT